MGEGVGASRLEVVVIGGGQAGLATAYYLRRSGLTPDRDFVVLDEADEAGGSWRHMWQGLRLFSPASASSLPGWMMPPWDDATRGYPTRDHVIDYLTRYEERYELGVRRAHRVDSVTNVAHDPEERLVVAAGPRRFSARVVVSATGTWTRPFWPAYPGAERFAGRQLHTVHYERPEELAGQRVVVVGGGNSAAQLLAEISTHATETTWVTTRPPRLLPDDVDGRVLFAAASDRVRAVEGGRQHAGVAGLGDIVATPSVRDARDRGVLRARPMFERLTTDGVAWVDGSTQGADTILWCTGFRPALRHLRRLGLTRTNGHPRTGGPAGTQSLDEPRLHLIGYGDWAGPASATLIGAGRTARATVASIVERLRH